MVTQGGLEDWIVANLPAMAASIVLFFSAALVICLWGFHTFLAVTNQTTWEVSRYVALNVP